MLVLAYTMAIWILGYAEELHGYGFPFDKANLIYLQRMQKIFDCLKEENNTELGGLRSLLGYILQDFRLQKAMQSIQEKAKDFDDIRTIMQIAPIEGGKGLNDDGGECNIILMEQELKKLIDSKRIKDYPDIAYKKMRKVIRKAC